ncbi:MAG: SPASM domain-containing protein [Deltaproteobacteria bacterium]|nr:SPASM domain-containing protein [Deltaproteobacteria bacterium]
MDPHPRLREHHLFERMGRILLYNVATMVFYEVTPAVRAVVVALGNQRSYSLGDRIRRRTSRRETRDALEYLRREHFLACDGESVTPPPQQPRRGVRHLELMVTHACNMRCRYCYGAHGEPGFDTAPHLYGATSSGMTMETARRGVDFLFDASGRCRDLGLVFFGGEPLVARRLIEQVVPYVRAKEAATGKKVSMSLSTNGSLLDREVVDFLVRNRIGCQVSIDGPKSLQDTNRPLRGGLASYESVVPRVRELLRARPGAVPARATLAHGAIDVPAVVEHLLSLGFGSVQVEPCIGEPAETAVTAADVDRVLEQQEQLAAALVANVRRGRRLPYTNLVRLVRQTRVVRQRLTHYCGAARSYIALSQDGAFYPCHRFVGMPEYRMGDLDSGLDGALQRRIVDLTVDRRPGCRDCWARYLCGGGCWKHAVDAHGSLETPDTERSCRILRHALECAMAVNAELAVSDADVLSQPSSRPEPRAASAGARL